MMIALRTRAGRGLALASLVLLMTGCAHTRIGDVLADPGRYAGRDVTIQGDVIESFSVLGRGAYQVEDDTGRLWVVSNRGVPRQGSRVKVRGEIKEGYDLSSIVQLPEEVRSAIVMVEESHEARR